MAILEAGHKLPFSVQPAAVDLPELQVGPVGEGGPVPTRPLQPRREPWHAAPCSRSSNNSKVSIAQNNTWGLACQCIPPLSRPPQGDPEEIAAEKCRLAVEKLQAAGGLGTASEG